MVMHHQKVVYQNRAISNKIYEPDETYWSSGQSLKYWLLILSRGSNLDWYFKYKASLFSEITLFLKKKILITISYPVGKNLHASSCHYSNGYNIKYFPNISEVIIYK